MSIIQKKSCKFIKKRVRFYEQKTIEIPDSLNTVLDNFIMDFALYQYSNNIGIIDQNIDAQKWIDVDIFLFRYLHKLTITNKIKDAIYEYGIGKGFVTLFKFYKEDLCIDFLQSDAEIFHYISQQNETAINSDIVMAIMRETIGLSNYSRFS
jgi:hypothetical protein